MALITSAQTGNFNQTTTWTGGVIPGVGDEARASDTHTITITANTTCDELSNAGSGTFILNGGVTLNANVTHKSATTTVSGTSTLQFTASSPNVSTINGNILGPVGGSAATDRGRAVFMSGTGTLNINGTVTGGSTGTSNGYAAVWVQGTGIINITGNIVGGSASPASGLLVAGGSSTITIVGNATGNGGPAISNNSTTSINLTGNVFGGAAGSSAIVNPGTLSVTGSMYASETASAISGGTRGQVTRLTGPFYTSPTFGVNPVTCLAWRWASTLNPNTFIEVPTTNLTSTRNFVTPDNATNFPSASNVRSGTTYGVSGALTGTCVIPPAGSVAFGVPVDNTTGTANVSPADFWSHPLSSAASVAGSVGEKLKKTAIPADIIALG